MKKMLIVILIVAQLLGTMSALATESLSREEKTAIYENKRKLQDRFTKLYEQYHTKLNDEETFLFYCLRDVMLISDLSSEPWLFFISLLDSCTDAASFRVLLKRRIVGINVGTDTYPAEERALANVEEILEFAGFSDLPYRAYFTCPVVGWRVFAGGGKDPSAYKDPFVVLRLNSPDHVNGISAFSVPRLTRGDRLSQDEKELLRETALSFIERYARIKAVDSDVDISEYAYLGKPEEPVAWIWFHNKEMFAGVSALNITGRYFLVGLNTGNIHEYHSMIFRYGEIDENALQGFGEEIE